MNIKKMAEALDDLVWERRNQVNIDLDNLIEVFAAYLTAELKEKTCVWTLGPDWWWRTACNRSYHLEYTMPELADYLLCPNCGGRIVEKEGQDDQRT